MRDHPAVPGGEPLPGPGHLPLGDPGIELEELHRLPETIPVPAPVLGDVHVHAYLGAASVSDVPLGAVGRVGDPPLRNAALQSADRSPGVLDLSQHRLGPGLDLIGQILDKERAGQRVGRPGDPRLQRDYLLGAQRQRHRFLAGELEGLVVAHHVNRLSPAEHRAQALDGRPDHVVQRLLRGQRGP